MAWLEDATVFLKVKVGQEMAAGTGFVIRAEGNTALIATNRHVITPDLDDDQEAKPEIIAVFRSGKGPRQEQSLPAEIVAVDSAEDLNRDLALLQVRGLSRPVVPIDVEQGHQPGPGDKILGVRVSPAGLPVQRGQPLDLADGRPGLDVEERRPGPALLDSARRLAPAGQ